MIADTFHLNSESDKREEEKTDNKVSLHASGQVPAIDALQGSIRHTLSLN